MRWLAALALGVFIATACADAAGQKNASQSTPSPSYVQWLPLPASGVYLVAPSPSPTPPIPIPDGTPSCKAGQLEAGLYGPHGFAGHTDTPMVLRNRGGSLCYVEGYADLTVLDSAGNVIAQARGLGQRTTFFGQPPEVRILLETDTPPLPTNQGPIIQELPIGQAEMHVEWYDCRTLVAARMIIDLPNGGGKLNTEFALKAPYSAICDNPGAGAPMASFGRGPIFPSGVRWPPETTYVPFAINIAAPASVKRATTLVYYVTVTNLSPADYSLVPCPDYNEFLLQNNPASMYELNCGQVRRIAAGASVKFEMHLTIPSDLRRGPNDLTWALMDYRVSPSVMHTAIEIT